ncbi:MAG TPA: glycosyltransferase family 4 protein [Acidobacteriota bacterium]|nr:glycosyltransferase family 4 protein [Acidobacteriota bacterium]HNT17599.1 glycosyltransferase family 4 protein [Acidobacteriota bacterium]
MRPVVMVSHFFPFPTRAGAEIRTALNLKILSELGEVVLVANQPGDGDTAEAGKYAREIFTVSPMGRGKMRSVLRRLREPFSALPSAGSWLDVRGFREVLKDLSRKYPDAVYWLEASWLLPALPEGKKAVVMDQHNLDSEVLRKRAENAYFPLSILYGHDFRKQRAFEKKELKKAAAVLAVSEEEKTLHERIFGLENVEVLPNLVDLDRYPVSEPGKTGGAVLMTGDFGYEPNASGAKYLVKDVMPLVREKIPEAKLVIAGKGSGSLPFREGFVELMGQFERPEDAFSKASVAAVPIFVGGGSRYKIIEALASGVPAVSTSAGAEGLDLRDGEGLLIREGAREFADGLVSILAGGALREKLSVEGRNKIEEKYSFRHGRAIILKALEKAGETA